MYKYTIDAYTLDEFGKPHDIIQLVVTALDKDEAVAMAEEMEPRGTYRVVRVEKLPGEFNTAMGLPTPRPTRSVKKG